MSNVDQGMSNEEGLLRDVFDDYFDRLGALNRHIKGGLVTVEDIKLFIEYQMTIMGDTLNDRKRQNSGRVSTGVSHSTNFVMRRNSSNDLVTH